MPKYKTYDDVPVKKKYKTYDDVKVKTHWEEDVSQPLDGDSAANNPIAPALILAKRDGNAAAAKKLLDNAPYVQAGRDGINAYADAVAEIERQDAAAKDAAVQATMQPMGYSGLSKALRDGSMPKKKNTKVKETRREGNPKYNEDYVPGVDYPKFRPYDDVEKELADVQARRDTDFNARFPEAGELVQRSIGGKDADADRQLRELAQQYADENAAYDARIAELKKEVKDSKNKTVLYQRERAAKQAADAEQARFTSPELHAVDEKIKSAEAELADAESALVTAEDAERALHEYEDTLRANGVSEQYFGEDSHYIELVQAANNAKKSAAAQKNAADADLYALRGAQTLAALPESDRAAILAGVRAMRGNSAAGMSTSIPQTFDFSTGKYRVLTEDEYKQIEADYNAAIRRLKESGVSNADIRRMTTTLEQLADAMTAAEGSAQTAKFALQYPTLASAISVVSNLASGVTVGGAEIGRAVGNALRGEGYKAPMNINGAAYAPVRATNDIRGTIAERIEEGNGFGGKVGSFAYQTLMSTADSVVSSVLGNVGGAAAIGGSAFASAIVDAKESGVSDEQALMTGICAGIFETLFERVSIGNFNKLKEVPPARLRDVAMNIIKSTVVNASEEGATEIANILADTIINGDYSGYAEAYRSYLAAGKSEKEAERLAKQDMAKQIGMAAFGGAVQGGFMGGIGTTWGYFGNRDANRAAGTYFTDENGRINAENRNALIGEGLASENEEIRAYAETLEDKRTMSQAEAGQLYRMLVAETQGNYAEEKERTDEAVRNESTPSTALRFQPMETYTPERRQTIADYLRAVNQELVGYVRRIKQGEKVRPWFSLGAIPSRAATDIQNLTGVNVSGFTNSIAADDVRHILRRHGENGSANDSMRDANDIARLEYVLRTYDDAELLNDTTTAVANADGTPAKIVKLSKKIDGTYYVVEAVPDSNAHRLRVLSAYISAKGSSHAADSTATFDITPETHIPYSTDTDSIAQTAADSQVFPDFSDRSLDEPISEAEFRAAYAARIARLAEAEREKTQADTALGNMLSGTLTNDRADEIAKSESLTDAFETLTGEKLTGSLAQRRKQLKAMQTFAAEKLRDARADARMTALKTADTREKMRAAVGTAGQAVYDAGYDAGVAEYKLRGFAGDALLAPSELYNANFGAYYRQGYRGDAFDFSGNAVIGEADARRIYEAGRYDAKADTYLNATERSAFEHGVSAEKGATAKRLSQVLGKEILFIDADEDFHGRAIGGVIYLGAKSERSVLATVAHEYTHLLESKGLYKKLRDFVFDKLVGEGATAEDLRASKRAEHEIYAGLDDEKVDREIVAEFVETRLLTDEQAMREVVRREGKSFARRLLDMLRGLIEKIKAALHIGDADAEQLKMLERGRDILAEVIRSEETVILQDDEKAVTFSVEEPLSEQIQKALAGELPPRRSVYFGKTSNLLVKLGLKQKPILASPAHMRENALPKSLNHPAQHGITQAQFEEIPKHLAHPVMVMDSMTRSDSIVVVTDMLDADGLPIIIAINTAGDGFYQLERERVPANFISSVHGKDGFSGGIENDFISNNANNNTFLFIDKEKSQNLFRVLGVQFPVRLNDFGFDKIIRQSRNVVNSYSMQNSKNDADIGGFLVGNGKTDADTDTEVSDTDKRFAPVESAIKLLQGGADLWRTLRETGTQPNQIALRMATSGESDAAIRELTGLYRDALGVWTYDKAWFDAHVPDIADTRELRAGYKLGTVDEQVLGLAPEEVKASRRRLLDSAKLPADADAARVRQAAANLHRGLRPTAAEFAEDRKTAAAKEAARLITAEKVPSADAAIRTGALLADIADVLEKKKVRAETIARLTAQVRGENGAWETDNAAMTKIIRAGSKQLDVQDFTDFLFENAKELTESSYNSQYGHKETYALDKLGVQIQNPIVDIAKYGTKPSELIANEREQEELKRYIENEYANAAHPTTAERADARDVATGIRTLGQISQDSRREVVLDLVYANLARRGLRDNGIETFYMVQKQRYAEELAQNIFKVPIEPGKKAVQQWRLTANTALRNNRMVFGEEVGRYLNETIFEKVVENEAERYRFMQREIDKIRKLKLTKLESQAVQMLAEDTKESRLAFYELLKGKGKNLDVEKCRAAVTVFRACYNLYYDAINEFLVMHGYKPIGFQKNYMPRLQKEADVSALRERLNALGIETEEVTELPAEIAGRTETFKPGKKYNPFFEHRTSKENKNVQYDALGGFDSYITYLSEVLYHTDDIQKLRTLAGALRERYASGAVSKNIAELKEQLYSPDPDKSFADIEAKLNEAYDEVKLNNYFGTYATWLDDYTNNIAGKQSRADREMEALFGRRVLNLGKKLNNIYISAVISGNISSALKQGVQIPFATIECGRLNMVRALIDMLPGNNRLNKAAEFDKKSVFLAGKRGVDYASELALREKGRALGGYFFEKTDIFVTRLILRAKFFEVIHSNPSISFDEAVREADRYISAMVGNRMKGSKPVLFNAKNVIYRTATVFQLENLNIVEYAIHDIPEKYRQYGKIHGVFRMRVKILRDLLSALVEVFLWNRLSQMILGQTPVPGDMIGILADSLGAGWNLTGNEYLLSLIDDLLDAIAGKRTLGTENRRANGKFNGWEALNQAKSDILDDIPIASNVSSMLGWSDGKLALPKLGTPGKVLDDAKNGDFNAKKIRGYLFQDAAQWFPGGTQLNKSKRGIELIQNKGMHSSSGKLMFASDMNLWDSIRAVLFGPTANEEYRESFFGGRYLSTEETELWQQMRETGGKPEESFNALQDVYNAGKAVKDSYAEKLRIAEEAVSEDLPKEQKREKEQEYSELREEASAASKTAKVEKIDNLPLNGRLKALLLYGDVATTNEKTVMDALEVTLQVDHMKVYRFMSGFVLQEKVADKREYLKHDLILTDAEKATVYYHYFANDDAQDFIDELRRRGGRDADIYKVLAASYGREEEKITSADRATAIADSSLPASAKEEAMYELISDELHDKYTAVQDAGGSVDEFLAAYAATRGITSDKDRAGNTVALSKARKMKKAIDAAVPDTPKKVRRALYSAFGVSKSVWY